MLLLSLSPFYLHRIITISFLPPWPFLGFPLRGPRTSSPTWVTTASSRSSTERAIAPPVSKASGAHPSWAFTSVLPCGLHPQPQGVDYPLLFGNGETEALAHDLFPGLSLRAADSHPKPARCRSKSPCFLLKPPPPPSTLPLVSGGPSHVFYHCCSYSQRLSHSDPEDTKSQQNSTGNTNPLDHIRGYLGPWTLR